MKTFLKNILDLSYSYAEIERDMYYPNRPRAENDAEHSYQMCLIAWRIIEQDKLPLDISNVFKLCIAHDLVEVYSGDVPLWGASGHTEKSAREKAALEIIKNNFGKNSDNNDSGDNSEVDTDQNDSELAKAITEYKERTTEEAKFVYGIDKLLPFLNQLQINGKVWKDHNIQLEQVLEKTSGFAEKSSHYLKIYFDEAMLELKNNPEKYLH